MCKMKKQFSKLNISKSTEGRNQGEHQYQYNPDYRYNKQNRQPQPQQQPQQQSLPSPPQSIDNTLGMNKAMQIQQQQKTHSQPPTLPPLTSVIQQAQMLPLPVIENQNQPCYKYSSSSTEALEQHQKLQQSPNLPRSIFDYYLSLFPTGRVPITPKIIADAELMGIQNQSAIKSIKSKDMQIENGTPDARHSLDTLLKPSISMEQKAGKRKGDFKNPGHSNQKPIKRTKSIINERKKENRKRDIGVDLNDFHYNVKQIPFDICNDVPSGECPWCFGPKHLDCKFRLDEVTCSNCGRRGVRINKCSRCSGAYYNFLQNIQRKSDIELDSSKDWKHKIQKEREECLSTANLSQQNFQSVTNNVAEQSLIQKEIEILRPNVLSLNEEFEQQAMGWSTDSTKKYFRHTGDPANLRENYYRDLEKLMPKIEHLSVENQKSIVMHFTLECLMCCDSDDDDKRNDINDSESSDDNWFF